MLSHDPDALIKLCYALMPLCGPLQSVIHQNAVGVKYALSSVSYTLCYAFFFTTN
jgi:hypothetical protein